jgi:hypothetical protein
VLKGGSKQVRGERLKWMFALVQELEVLRNFDLCFHLSTFATWELMPDIAQQAKVDLDAMLEVVKRYGDRKFWNGPYQEALQEATAVAAATAPLRSSVTLSGAEVAAVGKPCIPLLVYHSNLISGGFGGSESIIEKSWSGHTVSYINVSKFRSIGEQQQVFSLCSSVDQAYSVILKVWFLLQQIICICVFFTGMYKKGGFSGVGRVQLFLSRVSPFGRGSHSEPVGDYSGVQAPRVRQNHQLRAVCSRRRLFNSRKSKSFFKLFCLCSDTNIKERRVVKWYSLVASLESDEETVRMRSSTPFIVCPRFT